jgi:hypothetical protein
MGGQRGVIAIAAAGCLVVAGCGSDTAGEFDPLAAEAFIQNKARADVQSNPVLRVQDPKPPDVNCRERGSGGESEVEEVAFFRCEVRIVGRKGKPLGRQRWFAQLELDPATGDTIVRSSRRLDSTIDPAPLP